MSQRLTVVLPLIFQNNEVVLLLLVQILLGFIEAQVVLLDQVLAFQEQLVEVFPQQLPGVESTPVFLD
jgi:hypothetical protein